MAKLTKKIFRTCYFLTISFFFFFFAYLFTTCYTPTCSHRTGALPSLLIPQCLAHRTVSLSMCQITTTPTSPPSPPTPSNKQNSPSSSELA